MATVGTVTIPNTITSRGGGVGDGCHIKVKHNDTFNTLYALCSAICVVAGQEVKQGEVIGYFGTTGKHLYFEV